MAANRMKDRGPKPAPQERACKATTKRGAPCPHWALPGLDMCYTHAPEVEDQRRLARTRGGLMAARIIPDAPMPRLRTPEELTAFVEETIARMLRGEITPSMSNACMRAAEVAARAFDLDLVRRLEELERAASAYSFPRSPSRVRVLMHPAAALPEGPADAS